MSKASGNVGANYTHVQMVRSLYGRRQNPRYVKRENRKARRLGFTDVKHLLSFLLTRRMAQTLQEQQDEVPNQ